MIQELYNYAWNLIININYLNLFLFVLGITLYSYAIFMIYHKYGKGKRIGYFEKDITEDNHSKIDNEN